MQQSSIFIQPLERSFVSCQRGASLVEIQVALVVMVFGMLGVAGLLSRQVLQHVNGNARTAAAVHATSILDMMRSNPGQAMQGLYNTLPAGNERDGTASHSMTLRTQGAGRAIEDLRIWQDSLTRSLESATGTVHVNDVGVVRVNIRWSEKSPVTGARQWLNVTFDSRL